MRRYVFRIMYLTVLTYACSNQRERTKSPIKFTSFEISYTNGWTRGISLFVDSNKIFLSPQKSDIVKYGLLPDSMLRVIDTALFKIISDTLVKSIDNGCVDCSILAIKTIVGNDTISINQIGKIDAVFWPVIKTLVYFIDSTNHMTVNASLFLETQKGVFPPPLPPTSSHRRIQ